MDYNNMNNNMNANWNNMYNNNMNTSMNMNNFMNNNMGMNNMNNPMVMQMNMMLQQFYNQMQQTMILQQQQINQLQSNNVNNNAKATNRLPLENTTFDPFSGIPGPKANLVFQTAKGNKITIVAPYKVTVHNVLLEYMRRVGLGPNALYSGFVFLYNGAKINVKDEIKLVETITSLGNINQSHIVIVVVDTQNLIGS